MAKTPRPDLKGEGLMMQAVESMATSDWPLRRRISACHGFIRDAFVDAQAKSYLPADDLRRFEALVDQMAAYGDTEPPFERLTDEEVYALAREIVEVSGTVRWVNLQRLLDGVVS